MLIRVEYQNEKYDFVKPFLLDQLVSEGRVKKFFRSEGWTAKEHYYRRRSDTHYNGPERRKTPR